MRNHETIVDLVQPVEVPRVVPGDPDDDHDIAASVAGRVDLIVSGDRHLLTLGHQEGIAIISAHEARKRIAAR